MKKKEKVEKIIRVLEHYYPHPKVPLKHKDPYTLLIAVLLSAQSTDKGVNKVTPILFKKANTPKKMIALEEKTIEDIIRPCGLAPKKSKAIWKLSKILIEKHGGKVPQTFDDLENLPGVGHKTASVVMAQAFHKPAFPVDTHIHRCAKRWKLSKGKNVAQTEKDLKKAFPKTKWNTLHLQIIFFGREFCPARGHKIDECPICSFIAVR